jgi:hypothetical protein
MASFAKKGIHGHTRLDGLGPEDTADSAEAWNRGIERRFLQAAKLKKSHLFCCIVSEA